MSQLDSFTEKSALLPPAVGALHRELGIPDDYAQIRRLPFCPEATTLVTADRDAQGNPQTLAPDAAAAWVRMSSAAKLAGQALILENGFRSCAEQAALIRGETARGSSLQKALSWIAAPGFSEHQTGRAVDIACPGCSPVTTEFEHTDAYRWLQINASSFGFSLSYPRGNPFGIIFEPWHWYFGER